MVSNKIKKTAANLRKKTKEKGAVSKKAKSAIKNKPKTAVRTSVKSTPKTKVKRVVKKPHENKVIPHGEDLYLIPVQGEIHPARIQEARKAENIFHHWEEVALHQENEKAKAAMAARMGSKRIFRNPGRR